MNPHFLKGENNYTTIRTSVVVLVVLIICLGVSEFLILPLFNILITIILVYVTVLGWQLCISVKKQMMYQQQLDDINKTLTASQEKMKAINTGKDEFLSFATHQLRSPLTSFKWGLNVVADSVKEKPEITKIVSQLRETAEHMIDTVNDLLDISKIEQGGLVITNEPIDLVQFLDQLAEEYRITAGIKQLNLSFVTDLPIAILSGDKTKLRQVFVNIIDNAIKYTESGSITIKLSYNDSQKTFITEITDTGPGISPEELATLFEKFIRGNAGKTAKGGSGLGLYLGKRIVELHHGNVHVTSPGIGKGSTFSVTLPKSF